MKELSLLFFGLFIGFGIAAQPTIGCMEAKQKIKLHPLTEGDRAAIQASNERSDTIDILDYSIDLDVTQFTSSIIKSACTLTFAPKMENIDYLALDLLDLQVDSIIWDGSPVNYNYDGILIEINFPQLLQPSDTTSVTVYYQGTPTVDPSGFGGFAFESGYGYNLGIGLASNPYNFGRSWFPCFDNFVERSTYHFEVMTRGERKAYCVGTFMGQTELGGDTIVRSYALDQPIPTYLAGVAVSNYDEYNLVHEGAFGPVDIQLVAKAPDLNDMISTFASLGDAVDALEYWYGPYIWDRVGFVNTLRGAMEHPTNIAYPDFVGLGGDDFGHKRLMAHELAHCWFGDIVTLSSPADMWFKEGNAEYGAHLFTEYILNREAFLTQAKDNFLNEVLKNAHYDDDGFQPLSGIPYEQTYGTHTYRKGAAMIHNLRGYLGDSLFRVGQQHVLSTFPFSAIDADMYRDALIEGTGKTEELTSFFEDWIKTPGYAAYEIDSVRISPSGSEYEATVHIEQKLRAAPHYHTNTPLQIHFMDEDWNVYSQVVTVSDQFSTVQLTLPFEPAIWYLNGENNLHLGMIQDDIVVNSTGASNLSFAEVQLNVTSVEDSAYFRVDHYWVAPDAITEPELTARLSQNHYWRIDGIWPDGFSSIATLNYNGIFRPELDADLTAETEDSLILAYRAHAGEPWVEHWDYDKITVAPGDGRGFIIVQDVQPGEYAFANGTLAPPVSTNEVFKKTTFEVYPNPGDEYITVKGDLNAHNELNYRIYSVDGKLIEEDRLAGTIYVSNLKEGMYVLQLVDPQSGSLGARLFEIVRK